MSIQVVQSSSISSIENGSPTRNDGLYQQIHDDENHNNNTTTTCCSEEEEVGGGERKRRREVEEEERDIQLKFVGLFFTAFRRSVFGCSSCDIRSGFSSSSLGGGGGMEIGLPTNVRHVAHVTFDRFNGFLGLPVEFEPEVPRRAPSASTTVFGVSTNSMQLSFDTRGNSVPTILLLMQHRLYGLGGLKAEGIFRINPDNGQEDIVRDQLNRGLIPDDVDVHCLAGLIKAWFRELPTGILDCLSAEQVMESQTEEECFQLARLLPPTEAALLDWAVNLMADVAQFEHMNKMNARNVAMVFAPNMTHMADPLTALMHAVQVMNFLKTLIERTLKEREDSVLDSALDSYGRDPSGDNGCHTPLQTIHEVNSESEPDVIENQTSKAMNTTAADQPATSTENINIIPGEYQSLLSNHRDEESTPEDSKTKPCIKQKNSRNGQTSTTKKGPRKNNEKLLVQVAPKSGEKTKGSILVTSVKPRNERIEAWR
ncbi:rho GTPase-activating protein 5 [Spinacia oleracea]|uniref:Rho GTPase-activating protein 5 n=1 Tax=Spinacia oleracea TaxID=3562 RepID=A0A9R0JAT5_SPIOL|nr:rho GTPase-activating protein 5-like [Spinacia oleracea]